MKKLKNCSDIGNICPLFPPYQKTEGVWEGFEFDRISWDLSPIYCIISLTRLGWIVGLRPTVRLYDPGSQRAGFEISGR